MFLPYILTFEHHVQRINENLFQIRRKSIINLRSDQNIKFADRTRGYKVTCKQFCSLLKFLSENDELFYLFTVRSRVRDHVLDVFHNRCQRSRVRQAKHRKILQTSCDKIFSFFLPKKSTNAVVSLQKILAIRIVSSSI